MTISVIIATKNRSETIKAAVVSLQRQAAISCELIVVDQSTDSKTEFVVRQTVITAVHTAVSRVVYLLNRHLTGAGAARNVGIERATGDILVFLDDDVILEQNYLSELHATYEGNPALGGVSGMITNYTCPPLRGRLLEKLFFLGPFRDERIPLYWRANSLRAAEAVPIRKMSGCVMSIKRSALGEHRFDPHYVGAGAEDVELSWRISERWPLAMAPKARLIHLRTDSGPKREYWLSYTIKLQYYLYFRLWRTSVRNRLCFLWLNCGFLIVAVATSLLHRSRQPIQGLLRGIDGAREQFAKSEHPDSSPSPDGCEPSVSWTCGAAPG